MNTKRVFLVAVASCVLAGPVLAQESGSPSAGAPASAPTRPAAMDQLSPVFPIGSVKCTGKTYASPFGPEHATRLSMTSKPELDGFWIVARGAEQKTAENPNPGKFVGAYGYDSGKKKFIAMGYDNAGGHFMETSDGPADGKIVYTGTFTLNGNDTPVRDTITPTTHVGEIQVGGDWKKLDEETCTKK
jgi:uncharacterized protein DUF1579